MPGVAEGSHSCLCLPGWVTAVFHQSDTQGPGPGPLGEWGDTNVLLRTEPWQTLCALGGFGTWEGAEQVGLPPPSCQLELLSRG